MRLALSLIAAVFAGVAIAGGHVFPDDGLRDHKHGHHHELKHHQHEKSKPDHSQNWAEWIGDKVNPYKASALPHFARDAEGGAERFEPELFRPEDYGSFDSELDDDEWYEHDPEDENESAHLNARDALSDEQWRLEEDEPYHIHVRNALSDEQWKLEEDEPYHIITRDVHAAEEEADPNETGPDEDYYHFGDEGDDDVMDGHISDARDPYDEYDDDDDEGESIPEKLKKWADVKRDAKQKPKPKPKKKGWGFFPW